jgi:hypothetical protein
MKKAEIQVGGVYFAKVSGVVTRTRVDAIRERDVAPYNRPRTTTFYDVTNLRTGSRTTFRSAAKFRGPASDGDGYNR